MDSSQLCALGTVGVAAAGLAFGSPEHSMATRPMSNKRRALPSTSGRDAQDPSSVPSTPSPLPPTGAASTSRLRKRTSTGRPLSSTGHLRGGIKTEESTPDGSRIRDDRETAVQPSLHLQQSRQSIGARSFTFEPSGSDNIQTSWLHRKSTLSSLKSGSPATTERPGSSSVSYSNGSAAPIFPRDHSPSAPSRNKLVKRSASQRALDGGRGLHSTLRRPATSHQRSATLQRHFATDGEIGPRASLVPSLFDPPGPDPSESYGGLTQIWRPFFKPHIARSVRETSSRKRSALGGTSKDDGVKSIVATITDVPTLVMATSISTNFAQEDNRRASNVSALSRPFTPIGWRNYDSPTSDYQEKAALESKPRSSFSLTDMFPSPSPTTWKIPRSGSLRNRRSFVGTGGRRVVSAPQALKPRPILSAMQGAKSNNSKGSRADDADLHSSPLGRKSGPMRGYQVPPSSPLPPLNRLSAFEVDLPENVPSYPTSPLADSSPPVPRAFSEMSSPAMSSSMALAGAANQSHRPSGALSDHTSTLLGSENDNSRFMSGDEEDLDARSETVFDSTRTAATGNSLTGQKRPPIETIFDEPISPHILPTHTPVREENLKYITIGQTPHELPTRPREAKSIRLDGAGDDQDEQVHHSQESGHPTRSLQHHPSPASAPLKLSTLHRPSAEMAVDDDEALWSTDHRNDGDQNDIDPKTTDIPRNGDQVVLSPRTNENTPKRRQSPPSANASRSSKGNIFEWSERLDSETSPGGSPRPKTVHGRQGRDAGANRSGGRRGHNALHLRSQSVPVPNDNRVHNNPHAKLESWVLGNKGPSEDWDGDFDFEEPSARLGKQGSPSNEPLRTSFPSGIHVPQTILERQATVHSQFGQVKELTLLVEELKRLQQQASVLDIMTGQSIELWKEAEGIINLATLNDEEEDLFPSRSPRSPSGFDFDAFDEESPTNRPRRSGLSPPVEDRLSTIEDTSTQTSSRPSQELSHSNVQTPPPSRPRKESSAKAKSVLENIHQQRNHQDPVLLSDPGMVHKKLPFDTTSLKDLVTRAGVVTRALKEIVRRAEGVPPTPEPPGPSARKDQPDPPFSQMFHNPPSPPSPSKAPRAATSPRSTSTKGSKSPRSQKSQKSQKGSPYLGGGNLAGNDNEINGHIKMIVA